LEDTWDQQRCPVRDVPGGSFALRGTLGTVKDFTTGIDQGRFISTDPPVLWTMQSTKADYLVLDSGLQVRHTIPGAELAMDDLGPGNTVGGTAITARS
jgi:hypothetical protein